MLNVKSIIECQNERIQEYRKRWQWQRKTVEHLTATKTPSQMAYNRKLKPHKQAPYMASEVTTNRLTEPATE